jgi:hypothetical protein
MAQVLHSQMAWEELAEDPFRGLRAGPATFSPFLFLPTSTTFPKLAKSSKRLLKTQLEERTEMRLPKRKRKK